MRHCLRVSLVMSDFAQFHFHCMQECVKYLLLRTQVQITIDSAERQKLRIIMGQTYQYSKRQQQCVQIISTSNKAQHSAAVSQCHNTEMLMLMNHVGAMSLSGVQILPPFLCKKTNRICIPRSLSLSEIHLIFVHSTSSDHHILTLAH